MFFPRTFWPQFEGGEIWSQLSRCIWGTKSSCHTGYRQDARYWGFSTTYVSKCKNITRRLRNMVDSAFESWWSIFLNPKKILVIRTHPEELHVLKCITSTHISTDFSQPWSQQMLTKCYPTCQGCSCGFERLKVWPLGVPKPYRTRSYDASSFLTRPTFCLISRILWKICGIKNKHKNIWYRQRRWSIIWGCSIRFWNIQMSYF